MSHMKELNHLKIPLQDIKNCTQDFNATNVIGRGGYGRVYKGILSWADHHNLPVAVKCLDANGSGQGIKEFNIEITMLSQYHHQNIITLIGFCDENKEMILVYEYASRGSLDTYLSGDAAMLGQLSWEIRLNICVGVASALNYLHNHVADYHRIIHRDIKSANILLDDNWNPKLSDFGLSRTGLANQQNSFVVTNLAGTLGYCDPEYVRTGILTKESDVYSFGVVLFEVLCGRLEFVSKYHDERRFLHHLAPYCYKTGKLEKIIDPHLKEHISTTTLKEVSAIAYRCLKETRDDRPTIAKVMFKLKQVRKSQKYVNDNEGRGFDPLWLFNKLPWRRDKILKQKFFEKNGGVLLQQQKASGGGTVDHQRKIFTAIELEEATGHFSSERIVGQGHHGAVYKGMLGDSRIVAIKKLTWVDEIQVETFINVVLALSKINHQNVVKLLGCCLETEVPMLVYEYITNVTLFDFIHNENYEIPQSLLRTMWETRLQIATEIAGALAYLHSTRIYHRDIKSSNILLDDEFRAKLSDFGISKSVSEDQTHVSTSDPECDQSSDVYSFGIVLLELLTGKEPTFRTQSGVSVELATFILPMEDKQVLENVDARVSDAPNEQVIALAGLAKRCLNLNGKLRPNMKDVETELEGMSKSG